MVGTHCSNFYSRVYNVAVAAFWNPERQTQDVEVITLKSLYKLGLIPGFGTIVKSVQNEINNQTFQRIQVKQCAICECEVVRDVIFV